MASYDAFTLGGPYSVRGFSVGELAACRRFAEAAVELRVPVLGRQLFAFYETGTDLGALVGQLPITHQTGPRCDAHKLAKPGRQGQWNMPGARRKVCNNL